jgi:chromosome segregation protein
VTDRFRDMFVRRLAIAGFKSFADPIDLEFDSGLNVVVGPNGSGKSNIADALSWVLGSQAPASLRGGSMEDVIFAGSAGRPRLGRAEVTLTLDNSSGALPLDLTEVTISRFTDRSGASEYRINGVPCRLLDITELLSDTGIGRSLHTVVGQGQLDEILHARPEDRRRFIEEAAQIGKYRRRKERSLRKIERVEENLVRLQDMLSELTRAIRPLKRQAQAASVYSELVGEHTELRQRLAATDLKRLAEQGAGPDPEDDARREGLLHDELANVRARLESAAMERDSLSRAAEEAQQIAHGTARAADRVEALGRLGSERAAALAARLAAETEEGYRERIRLLENDLARWGTESESLRATAGGTLEEAERRRAEATSAKGAAEDAEATLAAARARETEAAAALVRAEGRESAGRAQIESFEARVASVAERRDLARQELERRRSSVEGAEQEVRALETELDAAAEAAAAAESRLEEARARADDLKSGLADRRAQRAASRARVDTLDEIAALLQDVAEVRERLRPLIDAARRRAHAAEDGEEEAARILAEAETAIEKRWTDVAREDEELRRLDALMSAAGDRLAGNRRRFEAREVEIAALDEELARLKEGLAAAQHAAIEERAALPARKAAVEEARRVREQAEHSVIEARERADAAGRSAARAELEARSAEERALAAEIRLEEAQAGIADAHAALKGLAGRQRALRRAKARAEDVSRAALEIGERGRSWASDAEGRAQRIRREAYDADVHLTSLRQRERELEQSLEEVTRRRNQAEIKRAELRARSEALVERSLEEWGLAEAELATLEVFHSEAEARAQERISELERQMRRMGQVNPRAAEEYAELIERETFLKDQIEDLKASRRDLLKIVREVDDTIERVFAEAYADVAREFAVVAERLFPGGSGGLRLLEPDDLLNSGIDVEIKPPGKNIKKLSLFSGGERALVALAFLFAIFRARPSPFYLLDEVEAALDDINLVRFLGLIEELEEQAQVMIVTHQKRTMEAADVLYGVSMAKDGVSKVVAKRFEEVVLP